MMTLLLSALFSANPGHAATLTVRVLERERPSQLTLDAVAIRCDAEALPRHAELTVSVREIQSGNDHCQVVTATGPASVTLRQGTAHTYAGTLRVAVEGGLLKLVNELDVEAYLTSVVGAESSGGPQAALEAQAIVSRTFALTSRKRHAAAGYDLCDLAHCQVYRGQESESPEVRAAVAATQGQVLLAGGIALKPVFFHAACGGHTSSSADVFGVEGTGPGVSDVERDGPLCRELPGFSWRWSVDRLELASALGVPAQGPAFEPLRRDAGGRTTELKSFGKRFSGDEFFAQTGRAFGYQSLRSLKVSAREAEATITFTGTGLGHGVGLCQQGARALATRGENAQSILRRYFPDCRVQRAPPSAPQN